MGQQTVATRLEVLERKVDSLEMLPARMDALTDRVASVELQIVQFREEVRGEFSAMEKLIKETRTHMLVLHEEVISRIALLAEGRTN